MVEKIKFFLFFSTSGKKYILEGENEKSTNCWLNALQQRRDVNNEMHPLKNGELPTMILNSIRRRRSRSRSAEQVMYIRILNF